MSSFRSVLCLLLLAIVAVAMPAVTASGLRKVHKVYKEEVQMVDAGKYGDDMVPIAPKVALHEPAPPAPKPPAPKPPAPKPPAPKPPAPTPPAPKPPAPKPPAPTPPAPAPAPTHAAKKKAAHGIGEPLHEYAAKCGQVLHGADIRVGLGNLEPVGALSEDDEDCKKRCMRTPTCNAAIRIADGRCYMKHVDVGVDIPVRAPGMNLYMMCEPADHSALSPPPLGAGALDRSS